MPGHPTSAPPHDNLLPAALLSVALVLSITLVPISLSKHYSPATHAPPTTHANTTHRQSPPTRPAHDSGHEQHLYCLKCVVLVDFDSQQWPPARSGPLATARPAAYRDAIPKRVVNHSTVARAPPQTTTS